MRLLIAIPHYYQPAAIENAGHGSLHGNSRLRIASVTLCLTTLRQNFGRPQCVIDIARRTTIPANQQTADHVDVVVCTTGGDHLLDQLPLDAGYYTHQPTHAQPRLLGFECHAVLRDRLGDYDYYGYLEDDLIVRDPWFFQKLAWFSTRFGDAALLLPNRYEVSQNRIVHKAYMDGKLRREVTAPFQDVTDTPCLVADVLGQRVIFERPLNPHAGGFFLNARQMRQWAERPDFLDRDVRFIGPLESAATLGVMRAYRVYKPAAAHACFFEIEHAGSAFLSRIRAPDEA